MRRAWAAVVMVVAVSAGWSCVETCVPGKTEPCACTDGRAGAQICRSNGSFEACVCTGAVEGDAGADAGAACARNQFPPQIGWFSQFTVPARIAVGQPLRIDADARDSEPDVLDTRWAVLLSDAGQTSGDGVTVSALGDNARIEFTSPGNYLVELRVSDGCQETMRQWPVEVVPAVKVPFAITGLACCDGEGRAFVIDGLRAQVMRLAADGGIDATLSMPRLPRSLSFDAAHARLVVAQDAYVSFVRVSDFTREFEWPVDFAADAVIANDELAWVYGTVISGGTRAIRATIDGGAVRAQSTFAPRVASGFLAADGGWMVFREANNVRVASIADALSRTSFADSEQACGALWEVRKRFVTGCGEAYELQRDGGLGYAGTVRAGTQLDAVGETAGGDILTSWFNRTTQAQRLSTIDGQSFTLQSEFSIGLWESELQSVLSPRFLISTPEGRVHVLTPDPGNDATWWQEF